MPLCVPRPLRPTELRVLYLLRKTPTGSRMVIAAEADIAEKAINRVMTALKDMKLIAYDAEGSLNYTLTLRGKCALAEKDGVCCQPRHRFVQHGQVAFGGDAKDFKPTHSEWVDEPCGCPLFGEYVKLGKCKSCCTGWTHEHSIAITINDGRPEV